MHYEKGYEIDNVTARMERTMDQLRIRHAAGHIAIHGDDKLQTQTTWSLSPDNDPVLKDIAIEQLSGNLTVHGENNDEPDAEYAVLPPVGPHIDGQVLVGNASIDTPISTPVC